MQLRFLPTLISLFFCAACTEEINDPDPAVPIPFDGRELVITAHVDNGPETKVAFKDNGSSRISVSWKESGESFTAFAGTGTGAPIQFIQKSEAGSDGKARFSGNIPAGTASLYAVYPALDIKSGSASSIALNLGSQSGTGPDENNTIMYACGSISDIAADGMRFRHLTSVMKVRMNFVDGTGKAVCEGTAASVSFSGSDLTCRATADITSPLPVLSSREAGTIPLSGSFTLSTEGRATSYLHILPGASSSEIEVCATLGDRLYKGSIPAREGGKAIEAGKVYNTSVTLREAVQTIFHVTAEGSAENTGAGWDKPTTLSSALAKVPEGGEIRIAAGTYIPDTCLPYTDCTDDEASRGFLISRNITIRGGYPASPAEDSESDPSANRTILSGNGRSYHVVYIAAARTESGKVRLNGLTITGGNAGGDGSYTISSTFNDPAAGEYTIEVGADHGGALTAVGSCVEMNDVDITDNMASNGPAAYIAHSDVKFKDGTISGNTGITSKCSGNIYILHEGINVKSDIILDNCIIRDNSNIVNGAVIYAYNKADNGGGMDVTVLNSAIYGNTAGDRVNFFRNLDTANPMNVKFVNTTITGNHSKHSSAMCLDGADGEIISCTITGNTFTNAVGGTNKSGAVCIQGVTGSLNIYNSIVTGNRLSSMTDSKDIFSSNVSNLDIYRFKTTPKVRYISSLIGSYVYGARYYNADGKDTGLKPLFRHSSQLAGLSAEGGSFICRLNGSDKDNAAVTGGMSASALGTLAGRNVSAEVLGMDQTGNPRSGNMIGATALLSGAACVSDPYLLFCGDTNVYLISAGGISSGGSYADGLIWKWSSSSIAPTLGVTMDNMSECKPADNGRKLLLTNSYRGCCAVLDMVSKDLLFYARGIPQAHSAELLPNNRIVVAVAHESETSTTDNQLRVYDMDNSDVLVASVDCPKAHGVLWSEKYQRLYAVGDNKFITYKLTDWDTANPVLTEESVIITNSYVNGNHDLTYISEDEVCILGNRAAIYDLSAKKWTKITCLSGRLADDSGNEHNSIKSLTYHPEHGFWYTDASAIVADDRAGDTWSTVKLRYRKSKSSPSDDKHIMTSGLNTYKRRVLHW